MARQPTVSRIMWQQTVLQRVPQDDGTLDIKVHSDYRVAFNDGSDQTQSDDVLVQNLTLPANPTQAQAKSALETVLAFQRNRIRTQQGGVTDGT